MTERFLVLAHTGQVQGRKREGDKDKYLLHKIMELLVCAEGGFWVMGI